MKILFIVSQFFQFMVANNLKLTEFNDCNADLIMYNTSNNVKSVSNNISKADIFDNVYFVDDIMIPKPKKYMTHKQRLLKKYKYLLSLYFPKKVLPKEIANLDFHYDVVMFFDPSVLNDCVFNVVLMANPNVVCYRFEEGFGSYTKEFGESIKTRLKIESFLRKFGKTQTVYNYIKKYYFFAPEFVLFKANYEFARIPMFFRDFSKLKNLLNLSFDYDLLEDRYDEKFIFFEDGSTYAYGGNEDKELLKIIVDTVGKENVFVKLHPRSTVNRFEDMGVKTNKNTSIPWEVILFNKKFDGKVLITTASSSAFSTRIYFGDNVKIIFLYDCMKNKLKEVRYSKFNDYMNLFIQKYGVDTIFVPNNKDQLIDVLNKVKN